MADEEKTIYTSENFPIPWFKKDVNNYLNKTTFIFGAAGTGKTTIIEEILYLLKDEVPNFLVVAPRTSDEAYRKKLHPSCITEDLSKEQIQEIWKRQYNVTKIYNIAHDMKVLESLFSKLRDRETFVLIEAVKRKASNIIVDIEQSKTLDYGQKRSQRAAVEILLNKKIVSIYRNHVRNNNDTYMRMKDQLSDDEYICMYYLDINPEFTLIIDDKTESFKIWMGYFANKKETNPFESIMYKHRWNHLTLIVAAHDDVYIVPAFRKNARVVIYTSSQAFVTCIERKANGFTPKERKKAMSYASKVFGDEDSKVKTHQKLCYIREDPHPFHYTVASLYPDFTLGCKPTREMLEKMKKDEKDELKSNPYIKDIRKM